MYSNGQTYIDVQGKWVPLREINPQDRQELRTSYFEENHTDRHVQYKETHFSMNKGDYQKPIL